VPASRLSGTGRWRPEFVTIYFLQGKRLDQKLRLQLRRLTVGLLCLGFVAVAARVWQEMQVVKLAYQNTALRQELTQLQKEQHELLSRRNALASLDRVDVIARSQLGMLPATREQVIFLPEPAEPVRNFWEGSRRFAMWLGSWGSRRDPRRAVGVKEDGLGGQDH
jgi:cell division protein FtsL